MTLMPTCLPVTSWQTQARTDDAAPSTRPSTACSKSRRQCPGKCFRSATHTGTHTQVMLTGRREINGGHTVPAADKQTYGIVGKNLKNQEKRGHTTNGSRTDASSRNKPRNPRACGHNNTRTHTYTQTGMHMLKDKRPQKPATRHKGVCVRWTARRQR